MTDEQRTLIGEYGHPDTPMAKSLESAVRGELDLFGAACRQSPAFSGMIETLCDRLIPRSRRAQEPLRFA